MRSIAPFASPMIVSATTSDIEFPWPPCTPTFRPILHGCDQGLRGPFSMVGIACLDIGDHPPQKQSPGKTLGRPLSTVTGPLQNNDRVRTETLFEVQFLLVRTILYLGWKTCLLAV